MSQRSALVSAVTFVLVLAVGCGDAGLPATTTPATATPGPLVATPAPDRGEEIRRSVLTYADLMSGFDSSAPVDDGALAMPDEAALPEHVFEGRLELIGESASGSMKVIRGNPDLDPDVAHLPEFDFEFVQSDNYLIPVHRGLIIAEHPNWNYILEPGRVWKEPGDDGYSRASFPFALVWKGSNAIFNGAMTFVFDDERISKVWYQVTQETTVSLSANFWGLLDATYHPQPVADASRIRDAFARELADRFASKPIERLDEDYPGINVSAFGRGVTRMNMTWYGFVVNGVNYVGGCQTRYGTYPYCESMRAPSYSTAKSAFVSVALMRLAQKYDPDAPDFLIKDFVPEAADSPGDWSNVTFNHTLDMATGNYRSAGFMVDEEHFESDPFWNEEYYAEIIAAAFDWPHSASPGAQWVYRTSDTFIVTRAMHNYLQTLEGPEADLFEFVADEVYKPLKMSPGTYSVLRTKDDDWRGQPYGGLGMWWIPDDIAKITTFLNVDGGAIDGEQILHPDLLAAALQRDPRDRGVDIDPRRKYNNAFWANRYAEADGFDCEFWVPHMLGYSGVVVALLPNGSTYYYASDNREFTWDAALKEADNIVPLCR